MGPLSEVSTISTFLTFIPGFEIAQCLDQAAVDQADSDEADADLQGAGSDAAAGGGATPASGLRTVSVTQTKISGLPLTAQLFHTVASPEVAYLLFALGLGLLLFELFTAGDRRGRRHRCGPAERSAAMVSPSCRPGGGASA